MSWHPQYRSSKFRHVFGKPASKENCYDSVPITHSVQDNHFCAVNPYFIAVVTECSCGGAFFVIPLNQVRTPARPRAHTIPWRQCGQGARRESLGFWSHVWVQILTLPLTSQVTLSPFTSLSLGFLIGKKKNTSPGISASSSCLATPKTCPPPPGKIIQS